MTTINNEQEWKLEDLSIRFNDWGDYKGKYTGKIKFSNKQQEAFMFNLTPEEVQQYIHLLKDKIVGNASKLGEYMIQSLSLLPAPASMQIGEEIHHEAV